MVSKRLLTFIFMLVLASCNFESSEEQAGGGLFNNNQAVENAFTATPPTNSTYVQGENIDITLTHPFDITVTGTPRIAITLDSGNVFADYIGGTGTKSLVFRYVVGAGARDTNGIEIDSSIDLNGGTLNFTASGQVNAANTSLTTLSTSLVQIDTTAPTVTLVTPPLPSTYLVGQQLSFQAVFDDTVLVSGTPRLVIDLGGSTVYATYSSGTNSTTLIFRYTVQGSDVDLDGIAMTSPLGLNGGSITDLNGNAAALNFTPVPMPTVNVNGDLPYVTSITPPADGTYYAGETIDLVVGFTEAITVTGTPRVSADIGANTKYLDYASGSGTNSLTFSYIVLPGDYDTDGIVLGNSFDLNGGTLRDSGSNDSALGVPNPLTPNVNVDALIPEVSSIIAPPNTYNENAEIFFTLQFNTNVDVTGIPELNLILDSSAPSDAATYISGTGTQNIVFKYTVKSGDSDLDGINIDPTLNLNGGTIISSAGTINADTDISVAVAATDLTGILIDAAPTQITGITAPSDGNYITAGNLDFTITFSQNVDVTGTPRIELNIGGSTVYADYQSGTGSNALQFSYTVLGGDTDSDGIQITNNSIDLNGGTIQDSGLNNATIDMTAYLPNLSAVLVNAAAVYITGVTGPGPSTYIEGQNLDFTVTTNALVNVTGTPRIQIDIGGSTQYANYTTGSGSTSLTFSYTIAASLSDLDGIGVTSPIELNGGTIQDGSLQNLSLGFSLPDTSAVLVDSINPTITGITPPGDNTYIDGDDLEFTLTTDEAITVTGTPRLTLDIGGSTVYANYVSGSGSSSLLFRYSIVLGDNDSDGIGLSSPVDLNGGTLQNALSQNLDLNFTPPNLSAVIVDGIVPLITSITPPGDATYLSAQTLQFTVNIDQNVDVTGTPRLTLDIGGTPKYANYQSGTGTNALVFEYVVENSLEDLDGITLSSPLDLNGGTIQNTGLRNLDTSLTPPTLTGVLVDSLAPTIAITTPLNLAVINNALDSATYTISGNCNEAGQTATIEVDSSPAVSPTGFNCNGSTFTGTIDTTGLAQGPHTLTATISDAAGNSTTSAIINVTKDSAIPTITLVTPQAPGTYLAGANIDFIVNLDRNTDVTGTPRISLNIGGSTRYANYASGTGTMALTFTYNPVNPDNDLDGINFVSTNIDLNGGTLADSALNPANLDLTATFPAPSLAGILVDTVIPTVTITSAPDITTANETIYFISGTCSEEGRTINVDIGGIPATPTCNSSAWSSGVIDVSGLGDNPALLITADLDDLAGNNALQASTTVDKDTATPVVTITSAPNITASNQTSYVVTGTCTNNGTIVDVNIDSINIQPNCSSGTWSTGSVDTSGIADNASLSVTADHAGASQAGTTISKDTVSPTVTISSAPNISLGNETSYVASGTCSESGQVVNVSIDSLSFTPNCNSGSWTTGLVDVSSLSDSAALAFSAAHSTAPVANTTIAKNTATPSISSLSVPTTLTNSADLNWTLNDPGGFTINDYEINYRIKFTPTWLTYNDGVSVNTSATVSGLLAATTYEFRIRVQYDTSNYSDWSTIAEGETKPDDPLFSSPYAAMNVGGSTETSVVAYYDNTIVTLNGTPIAASPLSRGQNAVITTSQFDVIDADKPIYTAGRFGSGGDGSKANMVWSPTAWAGKSFSFNATRSNPQNLYVYATENATITVKQGSTTLDTLTLTAGTGGTLSWSTYGSYQVTSTGTIMAYHMSGSGSTRHDPKPIMPGYTEIIGFPSNSMRITTDIDSTNYNLIHSDSTANSGNLNKQDVIQVNPQGGTTSLYRSESLIISADQKISGASFADSNGLCAAPFLPTNFMKRKYIVNVSSSYVAFASKQAGTIAVFDATQDIDVDTPIETLPLTRSGADPNAPYMVRRGTTGAGYRFVATVPVAAWYHPDTDTGAATNDETILYGTDD